MSPRNPAWNHRSASAEIRPDQIDTTASTDFNSTRMSEAATAISVIRFRPR